MLAYCCGQYIHYQGMVILGAPGFCKHTTLFGVCSVYLFGQKCTKQETECADAADNSAGVALKVAYGQF